MNFSDDDLENLKKNARAKKQKKAHQETVIKKAARKFAELFVMQIDQEYEGFCRKYRDMVA